MAGCSLCEAADGNAFYQDGREYLRCPICDLVFVPPHYFLSSREEKSVYDKHENASNDPRYRVFLNRLFLPLSQCLPSNSHGLDFGSGPGPTLSLMFEEAGHSMKIYDPFYAPENKPAQEEYDFISVSEVLEHLHHPRRELEQLWSCLKPNGTLGIMTKRVVKQKSFSQWHYINDPTHVCFYSIDTFKWLAMHWQATLTFPDTDVVLLRKSTGAGGH